MTIAKYRAIKCPCRDEVCKNWFIAPVAATQGVGFTEKQARAIAVMLNSIEPVDDDPAGAEDDLERLRVERLRRSCSAEGVQRLLHPTKDDDQSAKLIVSMINQRIFQKFMLNHFDSADYFSSVSKDLIVEAVSEAKGKEHAGKVAKMSKSEAVKYAVANVKGWVPPALRLGK